MPSSRSRQPRFAVPIFTCSTDSFQRRRRGTSLPTSSWAKSWKWARRQLWSLCDNSNPNAWMAEQLYGYTTSGLFGYPHLTGGYAGGQAQYARVPFADVGPLKVPDSLTDEQVLFLSDIFPTGYMAAENCDVKGGDTIAVW